MLEKQLDPGKSPQSAPRPGGRAARIQAAVVGAVEELKQDIDPADLTVPAIAARAGVTPSTIYRRWGSLAQLLSDVAVKRLRPDAEPEDTGDWRADLSGWLEQYVEETSSELGRAMLREVLGAGHMENTGLCSTYIRQQLDSIRSRAIARGDTPPATDVLMDRVIAPVMYRILFTRTAPDTEYAAALLAGVLGESGK